MAQVTLNKVYKKYSNKTVLNDINLEIKDKEFLVLLGPSGCGKTSLLRIIAGLDELNSGDITIGKQKANNIAPKDRNIAMVFQDYALYPHLSVKENLSFALKVKKISEPEIEKRVKQASETLNIQHLLNKRPQELSGGEKQRVAVGRCLVRKPEIFLFDEPFSNLDSKLRTKMRQEFVKLHRSLDASIIYVTHDQAEAMMLGKRIAIMKNGYIIQTGTPEEIYNIPSNIFVAEFVGNPKINFFDGELESSSGYIYFKNPYIRILLPEKKIPKVATINKLPVILGIRPHNIHVDPSEKKNLSQELTAKLETSELLGDRKNLYLNIGNRQILASVASSFSQNMGSNIPIWFDMDKIHIFDKKSQGRLI